MDGTLSGHLPRRAGHTLVVPRRGVQRLSELDAGERASLMAGVAEVQERLGKHFSTKDFTVCIHDGPLAGQEVPHVHVHVLPRTTGDGGGTLMSMWPGVSAGEPDHAALGALRRSLRTWCDGDHHHGRGRNDPQRRGTARPVCVGKENEN